MLARIGPSPWRYAAAAVIALAAGVGLLWVMQQDSTTDAPDNGQIAVDDTDTPTNSDLDAPLTPDAQDIELAAIDPTEEDLFPEVTQSVQTALDDLSDGIDAAGINTDDIWADIWSDMNDYDAFLADLETG